MTDTSDILHATTIAVAGKGVLIRGQSGTGKSALALALLARGADLIADDRTQIDRVGDALIARAPDAIAGLIEARYVGLINVPAVGPTPLALVIDMDRIEQDRLPHVHSQTVLGVPLPCLHKAETPHFHDAVLLYMRGNL